MNMSNLITNILVMTAWSTVLSIGSIMMLAALEGKPPSAPVTAISHIVYGEKAIDSGRVDFLHFAIGFGLNLMAMIGWSVIAEIGFRVLHIGPTNFIGTCFIATAVSVLAYITDFYVVPKRFTPGFEHILSRCALFITYVFLAISFLIGGMQRGG